MKTVDWDRVVTSAPLNKAAAVARDGKGTHWTPDKVGASYSDLPLPLKRVPPDLQDLTGMVKGRLRVLGLHDKRRASKGTAAAWVVRCACGHYETRRTKALLNPITRAGEDRCSAGWRLEDVLTGQTLEPTKPLMGRRA